MATPTSKGSPILKLVILVLVVVLILAIYIPSKMWKEQAQRTHSDHMRMEDIYRASQRFTQVNQYYTPSLEDIIEFIRTDTMMVGPARFERERLNLIPGERDSLLVGFPDSFHVESISWEQPREDSLILSLEPYPRYSAMPPSRWVCTSDSPLHVFARAQKETDTYVIVHTADSLRLTPVYGDSVRLATKDYLLSLDIDSIGICPTVRRPHELDVNVKITLNGLVNSTVLKTPSPDTVAVDSMLRMLVLNKFRGDALARTQEVVNQDTNLTNMKDSLMFAQIKDSLFYSFFDGNISELQPKDKLRLESDRNVHTSSDSIPAWEGNTLRIKNSLFSLPPDPLLDKLMMRDNVQDLFPRMSFEETYEVVRIDTVGLTIKCPINKEDQKHARGFIDAIFGVKMEVNHGEIKNGDLSWSEKR